ncbi:MAG: AmmeMemoRadiSam system protein B [Elusimicrobia bacterium]|nr:AmmeMemoRadiSam system protein B [Elusimicrobiota bacterium]
MKNFIFFALCLLCAGVQAREPQFAGKFYPGNKTEITAFVDRALAASGVKKPDGKVIAVVAPHAGYEFSGNIAGLAYKYVDDAYDTVVILASGHRMAVKGAALLASGYYETPLGRVQIDEALSRALIKANPLFEDKPAAHEGEHAVEVQLPFLQRRLKKPFKLVAATLNTEDLNDIKAMGAALAAALKGKKALLVVSTDFSHYPAHVLAGQADKAMGLAMESLDPALVWNTSRMLLAKRLPGLETCACGAAALETAMEAARLLGAKSFQPLKYADSYDEFPAAAEAGRVVGYWAGLFTTAAAGPAPAASAAQKAVLLKEARFTLEQALAGKEPPSGLEPDPFLNLPGAAFVTLTIDGALRGCVGTIEPMLTLMDAIRYGAYSAAFRDHRFTPLKAEELGKVKIEISLLSRLTPAKAADIKPGQHGVVVVNAGKSGLFLPQVWEQIPDKDGFLSELCDQKAGLPRNCWKDPKTEIYAFTVDAFKE